MNTKFQSLAFLSSLCLLSLLGLASSGARADSSQEDSSLEFNVGAVSDYRYRGLSQSGSKPALQGGVDWASGRGVYLGAWASSISWIKDTAPSAAYNVKGPAEVDLFGGYKQALSSGLTLDVGVLQYVYPSNNLTNVPLIQNPNTSEIYLAGSVGDLSVKISDSVTPLFGQLNSKGSRYLEINYAFELTPGLTLTPHLGNQYVANNPVSYSDYSLSLSKSLDSQFTLMATLISTNFKSQHQAYTLPGSGSKDLANSSLIVGVKKVF
jgi:uncharacterized protein (TIGR02001 family)